MYNHSSYYPSSYISLAKGGRVKAKKKSPQGLKETAEHLRKRGTEGDTILAHINPEEAQELAMLYGWDINPHTGLPQFGKWGKKFKKAFKKVAKVALPVVGSVVGNFISPGLGGVIGGAIGGGGGEALTGHTKPKDLIKGSLIGGTIGAIQGYGFPAIGEKLTSSGYPMMGEAFTELGKSNITSGLSALGGSLGLTSTVAPATVPATVGTSSMLVPGATIGGLGTLAAVSKLGAPQQKPSPSLLGSMPSSEELGWGEIAQPSSPGEGIGGFLRSIMGGGTKEGTPSVVQDILLPSMVLAGVLGGKKTMKESKEGKREREFFERYLQRKREEEAPREISPYIEDPEIYTKGFRPSRSYEEELREAGNVYLPFYDNPSFQLPYAKGGDVVHEISQESYFPAEILSDLEDLEDLLDQSKGIPFAEDLVEENLFSPDLLGLTQDSYAEGGYIEGDEGGQDDNIPIELPEGGFVINATILSLLGDGNNRAGNKKFDNLIKDILSTRFSSPQKSSQKVHRKVKALISPGEKYLSPEIVEALGDGNNRKGVRILKRMEKKIMNHKKMEKFPPKSKPLEKYLTESL